MSLKFIPLKFLITCFHRTFRRPWCLLKNMLQWISKIKSLPFLNLFSSEYLDRILPRNEIKLGFSVKLQIENFYLCLKQKWNKTQDAQTRNIIKSSSTFIRILEPFPEVKESALVNDYENIIAYFKESEKSEVNKCSLFSIHLKGLRIWCFLRKIWLFLLLFKIGNSIPALKRTQNCYINMKISFSWKLVI